VRNKPIFFIGEGRSGTTVIFESFAQHENIAFFSNYTDKFYYPQVGIIHRLFRKQGKKPQYTNNIINKFLPKTSEAYNTWEKLAGKKFRNTFLRNCKPSQKEKNNIKNYISKIKLYQNKKRFATKLTGPPRITYLNNIFENAYFINIIRNPRAVVASLINVKFRIDQGFEKPFWENSLTNDLEKIWEKYNKSPVALAALEWRSIYEQTNYESKKNNIKFYNLKYENFAEHPVKELKRIINFANLNYSDNIFKYTNENNYENMNYKYKERLSKRQVEIIEDICENAMRELNYLS